MSINVHSTAFYDLRELGDGYENTVLDFYVPEGVYRFSILVNGERIISKEDIEFVSSDGDIRPILTGNIVEKLGLDFNKLDISKFELTSQERLISLEDYVEGSTVKSDFENLEIRIEIPQYFLLDAELKRKLNRQFDIGEDLVFANYDVNGFAIGDYRSSNLNLQLGVNLSGWNYRHNGAFLGSNTDNNKYTTYSNYLEKALVPINSKVRVGSSYTDQYKDSFSFTGLSIQSEERMLPREMRGYAPVISGIAETNAVVEIYQNNSVIHREAVAPGRFEISNLRDTGSSGDLTIVITEEDGRKREFVQPYANSSNLLREGLFKYKFDIGKHDKSARSEAYFAKVDAKYGFSGRFTMSAGSLVSKDYISFYNDYDVSLDSFGVVSFGYQLGVKGPEGYTLQTSYSKDFKTTGTNLRISNLVYESEDWYSYDDYIDWLPVRNTVVPYNNSRSSQSFSLNQKLPYNMSANIGAYRQTFWSNDKQSNFNLSTSKSFGFGTMSLMYSQTKSNYTTNDKQLFVSLNVPIGGGSDSISSSYRTSSRGSGVTTLGYSGRALSDNRLSYSVQASNDSSDTTGAVNLQYLGSAGKLKAGYSKTAASESYNYGLSGSLVGFNRGIVMSQPLSNTFAIVDTSGVADIPIRSKPGLKTDRNGLAIVDYITPYESMTVNIDTRNMRGINVDSESIEVIPVEGAGVLTTFDARLGVDLLITGTYEGKYIPFGTTVLVNGQPENSVFGDNGELYLAGVPIQGHVEVLISNNESCSINYEISNQTNSIILLKSECM
ncbi:fimbria/pilus outer membrane usher protein [uncultured Vibrio sp.]|uniref:fimbria/pilus outer membrane usher protein n=1 Tax=uncultured Vibrio sp. TaxID=114054 RepID=UPI0026106F59|nr:fimbria/pilus outer membrane usher protein [uncultured Vibrio sp.]